MSKLPDRIEQQSLERIIRRAAELQAHERDLSEGLTEDDLLALGDDVGIPRKFLQQALWEERAGGNRVASGVDWLYGPVQISCARTILRDAVDVEREIAHWMTTIELLTVKRRYPDAISWEPRQDMFTHIKRTFGVGGRSYVLSHAREVAAQVVQLEPGACHVTLTADLSNRRNQRVWGSSFIAGSGLVAAGTAVTIGFFPPVAFAMIPLGALAAFAVARAGRGELDRINVALEQILDRLQHAEIELPAPKKTGAGAQALLQIADEIKDEIKKSLRK